MDGTDHGCGRSNMSTPAALVPVRFYAPVRIDTGNAGTFFDFGNHSGRITHVERQARNAAPEVGAGLMYNQQGRCFGDPQVGRVVNIWV